MPVTSNVVINEGQIIFKRDSTGHKHDGLTSSLIDTTKYSIFDFVSGSLSSDPVRIRLQENNKNILKTFIVSTIEERVLNPKGIRIQANAITANEIAVGTITANELVRDFIMVNNTMRSNNFNGTVDRDGNITSNGGLGWAITYSGKAIFNDVIVRGTIISNSGNVGGWTINSNSISAGNTTLYSNGKIVATGANIGGQINATSGNIGAYTINSSIYTTYTDTNIARTDRYTLTIGDNAKIIGQLDYNIYNQITNGYSSSVKINETGIIDQASIIIDSTLGGNTVIKPGIIDVNGYFIGPMQPVLAAASATHIGINGGYISYVTSRREHKYDIQDFTDLDIIDQFNARIFKWKKTGWGEESETEKQARESEYAIGFIVEELEEIENGRFVTYEDSERQKPLYWKIDNFIAMLVAEVQDLRKRVKILENGV